MDSETLQEIIHINLVLLYNKGHIIDFKEVIHISQSQFGMFLKIDTTKQPAQRQK